MSTAKWQNIAGSKKFFTQNGFLFQYQNIQFFFKKQFIFITKAKKMTNGQLKIH
jgi:hypothetical protein